MCWRPFKILGLEVVLLKLPIQINQYLAHCFVPELSEPFEYVLCNECSVRYLKWHHDNWYATVHHDGAGDWVQQNVELCGGRPVTQTYGTTHKGYHGYFFLDLGKGSQQQCQIGHSSSVNEVDFALSLHNPVVHRHVGLFTYWVIAGYWQ